MIVNLQRTLKIDVKRFEPFIASLQSHVAEAKGRTFSVAFISDRRMKELNRFFRDENATTDVLSFPHEPDGFENLSDAGNIDYLGDIVISAEQAARQAKASELTIEAEIKQLLLHGLLHLCGYDHETDNGEMNDRELQLRHELAI